MAESGNGDKGGGKKQPPDRDWIKTDKVTAREDAGKSRNGVPGKNAEGK